MSQQGQSLDASIITLSFSRDFDCCRMLCDSIDRFAPAAINHRLFVPTPDLPLFSALANDRRSIGLEFDLMPRWLWKLPMPNPRLRNFLRLPRRNIYLSTCSLPVRGWIAQQIMKISAAANSPTEIIVHVDSDGVFIRPLTADMLARPDGKVRFYRHPQKSDLPTHQLWRETACRLLGLKLNSVDAGDYIDICVVWRRSVVRRMIARLEEVGGADWRKILARTPNFSEYTLYGLFVESLGIETAGHFRADKSQVHGIWTVEEEPACPEDETKFVEALQPHHIACLIQSTMTMSFGARRSLLERVTAEAAKQDDRTHSSPAPDADRGVRAKAS